MECRELERLAPLIGGRELDAKTLMECEEHLAHCQRCAEEMRQQQHFDSLLRQAVLEDACDAGELRARIQRRIADPGFLRRWRWPQFGMVAAAALALGLAGGAWRYSRLHAQPSASLFSDACADHNDEVVLQEPREWLTAPQQVSQLMVRRGLPGTLAQQLAPQGFRFERARICDLLGKSYAHLVYGNGATEISVFVRHDASIPLPQGKTFQAGATNIRVGSAGELAAGAFTQAGMTVVLVDALSPEQTLALAQQSSAQI